MPVAEAFPVIKSTGDKVGALQLWGWIEGKRLQWIALTITLAFVWFEARYNIELLNTLSDPAATSDAVDRLSQRGKMLASLGITWAIGRSLITKIQPAAVGLGLFLVTTIAFYVGLDYTYTKVISGLKPEIKVEGFTLFNYRHDLLTGKLEDPDIPLPKNDPVLGKILMGAFPIVLLDERFMLPARDIVERKSDDKSKGVMTRAEQNWMHYNQQMRELDAGHREYISGSRQALQYRAYGGIQKFQKRSGGLNPDPNLSKAQFIEMLRSANHPRGEALRRSEAREIGKRANGGVVYARDVPYFMTKNRYLAWFESQATEAKAAALPTIETVEKFRGIVDINSAVFLPPMAIITSLTSALTNMITLVLMLASIGLTYGGGRLEAVGHTLSSFSAPLMAVVFATALYLMPSHIFREGTPMHALESKMHRDVGIAGQIWSRLSNLQAQLLK